MPHVQVATVAERALYAWLHRHGVCPPRLAGRLVTVTWIVALSPLFALPWIKAGHPARMYRPLRPVSGWMVPLQLRLWVRA